MILLKSVDMKRTIGSTLGVAALAALLVAEPAHAFRCGNRIVQDGMHEQQVLAVCGEPTSVRHLGYTIRALNVPYGWRLGRGWSGHYYPGWRYLNQEVVVTEYIYNFGPRKFMRRLVFEGSVLVKIERIGYGYLEKQP